MHDQDVRTALLESVPDAPPPPYTAASLLTAAVRDRRRRRVTAAGLSLLAVAVVAGSAVTGVDLFAGQRAASPAPAPLRPIGPAWDALDPSDACAAVGFAVIETPDQVAQEYEGYDPPYPTQSPGLVAERLTCYLQGVVPTYLPGATYYLNLWRSTQLSFDAVAHQPLEAALDDRTGPPDDPNIPTFSAGAIVADAGGVGTIEFQAAPATYSPAEMADDCRAHADRCELRTGPHGETVGVWVTRDPGGYSSIDVDVHLGHTVVIGVATNTDPSVAWDDSRAPRAANGGAIGREAPPLTADQLIAILATARLDLLG